MILVARHMRHIPDSCGMWLLLFDDDGAITADVDQEVGYRASIVRSKIMTRDGFGADLIKVDIAAMLALYVTSRRYYCSNDDRLVLLRVENDRGKVMQSQYSWNWFDNPTPVPEFSPAQWLAMLNSQRPEDVIESLNCLAMQWHGDVDTDNLAQAIADPAIRARISELGQAEEPWVGEIARILDFRLRK
jgi:hypothetical protein